MLPKGKRKARDEDISLPEKADGYDDIQFEVAELCLVLSQASCGSPVIFAGTSLGRLDTK